MAQAQLTLASNSVELERLIQTANRFIHSAKAPATVKAYRSDWRDFASWCLRASAHAASGEARNRGSLHR